MLPTAVWVAGPPMPTPVFGWKSRLTAELEWAPWTAGSACSKTVTNTDFHTR